MEIDKNRLNNCTLKIETILKIYTECVFKFCLSHENPSRSAGGVLFFKEIETRWKSNKKIAIQKSEIRNHIANQGKIAFKWCMIHKNRIIAGGVCPKLKNV